MTLFPWASVSQGPISKYDHVLRDGDLGLHRNFGGTQFNPQLASYSSGDEEAAPEWGVPNTSLPAAFILFPKDVPFRPRSV